MTEKEKKRNSHLLRTYGISLQEFSELLEDQGGGCFVCGKRPSEGQRSLSLDHDHSWKKVPIKKLKDGRGTWWASAEYRGATFVSDGKTKAEAVNKLKRRLLRASCRGILCVWCNRGLRYYHDNPRLLKRAAFYLERLEP